MAHALNLPTKIKEAVTIAANGGVRHHDIGKFNVDQYFSYVASFGAFTKVAYTTPQLLKNLIGRIAYIFNSILSISDIHTHTVTVVADGKEITGDFIYGSVSNSTIIGGVVKFQESEIIFDDGMFEVLLIKNPQNAGQLRNIIDGLLHYNYDEKYVYFFKANKIAFSFQNTTEWTIDGEYAGTLDSVFIETLEHKAQVITTPNTA